MKRQNSDLEHYRQNQVIVEEHQTTSEYNENSQVLVTTKSEQEAMARFMNEEEANIPSGRVLSPSKEMKIEDLKRTTAQKNGGDSGAKEISDTYDDHRPQDVSNFEAITYEGFNSANK